jgi:5-methylcytosine-specific restriction protein A
VLSNVRCLCAVHDAQIKEDSCGKRKNNGKPYVQGCDATGKPLDPDHWWNLRTAKQGNKTLPENG